MEAQLFSEALAAAVVAVLPVLTELERLAELARPTAEAEAEALTTGR
jgi:hypothetical protein